MGTAAVNKPGLVTTPADFAAVNEALARMIASADREKFFHLLTAFPDNKELQMKLFSENDPGQAKKAYEAFVKLTDAVRASSTNGATPFETTAASGGAVGDAAQKFSDATYPLVQKIDWGNTPIISKYIAEVSAKDPSSLPSLGTQTFRCSSSLPTMLVMPRRRTRPSLL